MAASHNNNNNIILLSENRTPNFQTYSVNFNGEAILTTVTNSASIVSRWIHQVRNINQDRPDGLVIGLDVERLFSRIKGAPQPVATLQLCVGNHCLIFQIFRSDFVPETLVDFLRDTQSVFVGVGVEDDLRRLRNEHELVVPRWMDLCSLAVEKLRSDTYKTYGLKRLAGEVLEAEMEKPRSVCLSDWGVERLSRRQVEYACIDAKASFDLGLNLIRRN